MGETYNTQRRKKTQLQAIRPSFIFIFTSFFFWVKSEAITS